MKTQNPINSHPNLPTTGVNIPMVKSPCHPGLSCVTHGPYNPGGVSSCPACGMAELSAANAPYQKFSV